MTGGFRSHTRRYTCLVCLDPSRSKVCRKCDGAAQLKGMIVCRRPHHRGTRVVPIPITGNRYLCAVCRPPQRPPAPIATPEQVRARLLEACAYWERRAVEQVRIDAMVVLCKTAARRA